MYIIIMYGRAAKYLKPVLLAETIMANHISWICHRVHISAVGLGPRPNIRFKPLVKPLGLRLGFEQVAMNNDWEAKLPPK